MLPRQLKEIQFGQGLNTKADERAQPEQMLDIAVNVEFDDIGGLRCRFPFDSVRTSLVGGGTLTNARRLAMLGSELVCFTDKALYSWVAAEGGWMYRGDHLAVATDEQTVFAQQGDQLYADRAELLGHIIYCWMSSGSSGVHYAIREKSTGALVQPDTAIVPIAAHILSQPRLIALNTCVLLFWLDQNVGGSTVLNAAKITVNPYTYTAAGAPIGTMHLTPSTSYYDVARIPGADRCLVALGDSGVTGQYTIISVDSTMTGGAVTNGNSAGTPVAIAISPDAAFATVAGCNVGTQLFADVWNVTPAATPLTNVVFNQRLDNTAATQVGANMSQITAQYQPVTVGGHYRCYVFWSHDESDAPIGTTVFESCKNWIDSTGTLGGDVPFVYGLGIAAHAFAHDSHVYLVGVFAGLSFSGSDPTGTYSELQNTYYLYRDDGLLVGKAAWGEAGGFQPSGWLPNVNPDGSTGANTMVFMGAIRRLVPVGKNANLFYHPSNYAERAPREIAFTFDDDRARRCVQFGETLYILGSLILQYDGAQLAELGSCTYPWVLSVSAGAAGAMTAGGYSFKATNLWMNAKGETDRSTTGTVSNYTNGGPNKMLASVPSVYVTRKTGIALELWRTQVAPTAGVPFFLVTSPNPNTSGDNAYAVSAPTSNQLVVVSDNYTDAQIGVLAANPENGSVLPSLEPPPATIAYADNQRIYLAGIPGYPNTIYYSKYRQAGQVAGFNDGLTFDVPADGGAITAIGYLDGALIVWCGTATYQFAGAGFDDTGGGANFQLSRVLSKDLGCVSPEACAYFDGGFLVKTNKGWFVLDRSLNYEGNYVGAGAFKYDAEPVVAMSVLTGRHQVRILTNTGGGFGGGILIGGGILFGGGGAGGGAGTGRILVFDTLVKQWAETSVSDGLDMLLWNGTPAYLTAAGVRAEIADWGTYTGNDYTLTAMDVETGWIKFGAMQARAIVDFVKLLGEFLSTCVIRHRFAKDYEATAPGVWNYHTDVTWTPSPGTVSSAMQQRQAPAKKRCESFKVRYTVTAPDGVSPLGGQCVKLTTMSIPFAIEPNTYGAMSSAQEQ